MDAMGQIRPTSKFDLKMQCIAIAHGDVEEAEKLYNFLAGDITIPDITPTPPTLMQQIKENAAGVFNWIKDNRGDLAEAYNYIQAIRRGEPISQTAADAASAAVSDLPPIPPME